MWLPFFIVVKCRIVDEMIDNVNLKEYTKGEERILIIYIIQERDIMATVPTQVRIDEDLKKQAAELFGQLGMDMSSAVNIFLRQCVLRGGLPFKVELPDYKPEVIEAMEEAKKISRDNSVKGYTDLNELFKELDS